MNPIHGLLAFTLSALAAAGSPLPPAVSTSTLAADDLIEMARSRGHVEADTAIHYHPDEVIVIDGDVELRGLWVVEAFEVEPGAQVVATADLTIIARRAISVSGQIQGLPRLGDGVDVTLRSFGPMLIDGQVVGGDAFASSDSTALKGGAGGDVWLRSTRTVVGGFVSAGNGAEGALGMHGGNGGNAVTVGPIWNAVDDEISTIYGGDGGLGGPAILNGNNGGDGGTSALMPSLESPLFKYISPPRAIAIRSFAMATPLAVNNAIAAMTAFPFATLNDLELTPCEEGKGDNAVDGLPGSTKDFSNKMYQAPPRSQCCQNGANGSSVPVANGGDGHDGSIGSDAAADPGHGGYGGRGGRGGLALGADGMKGGQASDCCEWAGQGCGAYYGKVGGNGGAGGNAKGGKGATGGAGGKAKGDCTDGIGGIGGTGGHGIGGTAGDGGDTGASESGVGYGGAGSSKGGTGTGGAGGWSGYQGGDDSLTNFQTGSGISHNGTGQSQDGLEIGAVCN